MTLDSHNESSQRIKEKRTLNTPVSPGKSDTSYTTNECHSNEHPGNLVSGDKISQGSSQEPTQLCRRVVLQDIQEMDLLIPEKERLEPS